MNENILDAIPVLEKDVPAADFMVNNFWIPLAWGLGVALLLAALGIWWALRRRKRPVALPPTPLQVAFAELDRLAEELPALRECSLRLSMLLRTYLTGEIHDPALYETHEEFSRRMDALSGVPASCRFKLSHLLERLADMKYGGFLEQDPQKARTLIEEARSLVADIDRARAQELAAAAAVAKVKNVS